MSQQLSRRTLLCTGAAAGAAGIAAGSLGVVAFNATNSSSSSSSSSGDSAAAAGAGPIVLHVVDARTGAVEIFAGDRIIRLRDTGITSRISSQLAG